jgi:beta-N-acetylhexosaminidase
MPFPLATRAALFVAAAVLAAAAKPPPKPKPPPLTPEQRAAQALLKPLSLHDRVAQMVIGVVNADPVSSSSVEFERYRHWVRDLHIGGLIVNNSVQNGQVRSAEPYAMAVFLNRMQKLAKIPLLVGGDFERASSMRVADTVRFPYNMAYGAAGDLDASRYEGLAAAREARALGVQWIFAPVADVNSNPDNPIINIRSYGEDPEAVSRHVAAFIDGAHSDPDNRVLVTAKHFPGHGDTSIDSHMDLALLDKDRDHMDAIELKPFEAAIAHGVDAIMTAHMAVPAIEPEDIPATVSPLVLTGLLRNELKFQNIIVTDAMDMAGLTKEFKGAEASVRAVLAGADVLLMPPDPEQAIRAVVAAVENGRIPRQRIDDSATRVLAAKIRVGLTKTKLVNVETVADVLEAKESGESAQRVSDRAVTLLVNAMRNEGAVVPLTDPNHACVIIAVQSRASTSGPRFAQEFARRAKGAHIVTVDSTMPEAALDAAFKGAAEGGDANKCSAIVVSADVAVAANRGDVALAGDLAPFIQKLTEGPVPVVLVAVGNPYLLASFPKVAAYLATFSITQPSEFSAVKALFGQIPITGRTPVSIPGFAAVGDGIQLPGRTH